MTRYTSPTGIEVEAGVVEDKLSKLLGRPYDPPELYIFEEVELGGGYHRMHVTVEHVERDWSEPYTKSGKAQYRNRIVKVPYPPD